MLLSQGHTAQEAVRQLEISTTAGARSMVGWTRVSLGNGLVLLDDAGDVLRPAILWNDQRTERQCADIRQRVRKSRLIAITDNDALTGFNAPKNLWVQQEEPEVWAKARHILLPKDYIRYRLTDDYAMDRAGCAGTILFDLKART